MYSQVFSHSYIFFEGKTRTNIFPFINRFNENEDENKYQLILNCVYEGMRLDQISLPTVRFICCLIDRLQKKLFEYKSNAVNMQILGLSIVNLFPPSI